MKKNILIALLLCMALLFQLTALPISAEAADDPTSQTEPSAALTNPSATPGQFGSESILNGCRTIEGQVPLSGSERRLDTAQAVFVFDTKTNTVVYSYNPDLKLSPGTLAKIVTALVAIESCELDEVVVCHSKNISRLPGGTQNVKLKELEELTVEQLLYCLILHGANDAAIALAEHIAGNMESFVTLMNARIQKIGCVNTQFANVHGLDNGSQYTTARDMAKILIEAQKNEKLKEILNTTSYEVPATNRSEARSLTCQNYLIDEITVAKYYDKRVTGGLASYSDKAGANLACSAENSQLSLVLVILGCDRIFASNGWLPTYYGNFDEMIELLEFAFNGFKSCRILYEGQSLYQLPVTGGECSVVVQPNVNYDSVLPADCQFDNLIKNITNTEIIAPVKEGDVVATISLWYRSSCVAEAELYAMSDVQPATGTAAQAGAAGGSDGSSGVSSVIMTVCLGILAVVGVYLVVNAMRRAYGRAKRRRRRANRRRSW